MLRKKLHRRLHWCRPIDDRARATPCFTRSGRVLQARGRQPELRGDRAKPLAPLPHAEHVVDVLQATEQLDRGGVVDVEMGAQQRLFQRCHADVHVERHVARLAADVTHRYAFHGAHVVARPDEAADRAAAIAVPPAAAAAPVGAAAMRKQCRAPLAKKMRHRAVEDLLMRQEVDVFHFSPLLPNCRAQRLIPSECGAAGLPAGYFKRSPDTPALTFSYSGTPENERGAAHRGDTKMPRTEVRW
ncbi:hypothetical protein PUN4_830104 [Paraburkholderia unamae]|nr:hypothetical protein PUN4_830104 [Paraburkholderia unamae]